MDTKLVIFDLDGTLLDTIDDLAAATNHALQQNGYPAHERSAYRYFVGNGITKLMERALPEDQRNEKTVLRVRQDFVDYYSMHNMDYTIPIVPGPIRGSNRWWGKSRNGASVWPSRRTNIRRPPPN